MAKNDKIFNSRIVAGHSSNRIKAWTYAVKNYDYKKIFGYGPQGDRFFLKKDYSNDLKMDEGGANKVLEAIDKIRQPLRELESDNKEKCVQYLKNLNALSKIYNN